MSWKAILLLDVVLSPLAQPSAKPDEEEAKPGIRTRTRDEECKTSSDVSLVGRAPFLLCFCSQVVVFVCPLLPRHTMKRSLYVGIMVLPSIHCRLAGKLKGQKTHDSGGQV